MIDFASALYLGLRHPARALGDYAALTSGHPAALAASPLARQVSADAAALQGSEAGMVAPSTLHLAIDVFDALGRTHVLIADEALYPVMRWGIERARGLGAPVAWFRQGDLGEIARLVGRRCQRRPAPGQGDRRGEPPDEPRGVQHAVQHGAPRGERHEGPADWPARPPALVTDATRADGSPVPLPHYLQLVQRHGGLVVIDHSQMLGLMGARPSSAMPWGAGGGGALQYAHRAHTGRAAQVLLLASWAKAFGAPLATLCGPLDLVRAVARDGPTQVHSSTASQAALLAARRALALNRRDGESLRARLWRLLCRLRAGWQWLARTHLPDLHMPVRDHPLQQVRLESAARTLALHAGMRAAGFRTALLRQADGRHALAVIVRADHAEAEIDALLAAMANLAPRLPTPHRSLDATDPSPSRKEYQHV